MMSLPIVERELRVQARRNLTRWARWWIALFACFISLVIIYGASAFNNISASGQSAYAFLVGMGVFLAAGTGILSADAIAVERREGTLGFLFLTDLQGYDVILGKLAACGLLTVYAMLALLPALSLPVLVGGVTVSEVFRAALGILNTTFFSLVIGLFMSTLASTRYQAQRNTALLLAVFFYLPLFFENVSFGPFSVAMLSPIRAVYSSSDLQLSAIRGEFWMSLLASHVCGWIFLWLTSRAISANWRKVTGESRGAKTTEPRRKGKKFLGNRPIFWRAYHQRGQGLLIWVAVLSKMLFWILWIIPDMLFWLAGFLRGGLFLSPLFSALIMVWVGGRFFAEARQSGELELLLSTPVAGREFVSDQWRALWRHLRWPLALLFGISLFQMFSAYTGSGFRSGTLWGSLQFANYIAEIIALASLGMWFGLRRRMWIGLILALVWAKLIPWLLLGLLTIFLSMWMATVPGASSAWILMGLGQPVFFLGFNLLLFFWGRRRLLKYLNERRGSIYLVMQR